jgi:hypothetical protein
MSNPGSKGVFESKLSHVTITKQQLQKQLSEGAVALQHTANAPRGQACC